MTDASLRGPLSADKGARAAPVVFSTETAPSRSVEPPGRFTLGDLAEAICGSPDPAAALRALADAGRIGLVEDPIAGLQIRVRRLPGR